MNRKLVNIYHRTLGPQNPTTLERYLNVVKCIMLQGQYNKAHSLHQNLRSEIPKLSPPDRPLAICNTRLHAALAKCLNQYDTAEKLQRQLLK